MNEEAIKFTTDPTEAAQVLIQVCKIAMYGLTGAASLVPAVRELANNLVAAAASEGMNIEITSCFRTFALQESLYSEGRTTAGNIVTNAQAGESYHNYGLAFDVKFTGETPYPTDQAIWDKLATLAEGLGLVAGARFGDNPHFEFHPNITWQQLRPLFVEGA